MLRLGILRPDDAAAAERCQHWAVNDRAFLTNLVRLGRLTPLQAVQVGRGRAHHLAVGPYVIEDRIGSGGMGRVFRARHRRLEKSVALKLVRLDRRKCPSTVARFRREVLFASRLNHLNVVHTVDAGVDHRSLFLVMEHVDGIDLARLMFREGRLEAGPACEYVRQAALGLHHIHERGLVHRDVKPANLGLNRAGTLVKVMDLGLASPIRRKLKAKGRGRYRRLLGSPDYVSPDQIADPRRVGPQADVYALGCTLYHLLAGHVPFPGGTASEKARRHLGEEPLPIEEARPGLPAGLGDIVRKMMAKKRSARYASALAAAEALAPFAALGDAPAAKEVAGPGATTVDLPTAPNAPLTGPGATLGSGASGSSSGEVAGWWKDQSL